MRRHINTALIVCTALILSMLCTSCAQPRVSPEDVAEYEAKLEAAEAFTVALSEELTQLRHKYDAIKSTYLDRVQELTERLGAEQASAVIAKATAEADRIVAQIEAKAPMLEQAREVAAALRANPPQAGNPWWIEALKIGGTALMTLLASARATQGVRRTRDELIEGVQDLRLAAHHGEIPASTADIDGIIGGKQSLATRSAVKSRKESLGLRHVRYERQV